MLKKKPRRIKNLKIDVISFVDSAANKKKFAIFKCKSLNKGEVMKDKEFAKLIYEIKKGEKDRSAVAKKIKALMIDPSDESMGKAFHLIDAFMMSKMLEKDLEGMIAKSIEDAKELLVGDDTNEDDIEALLKGIEDNIEKQNSNKTLELTNKLAKQLKDDKTEAALATAKKLMDILKKHPVEKVKKELSDEEAAEEFVTTISEIQKKGAKLSALIKSKISAAIKALQEVLGDEVKKKEGDETIEFTKEEKDEIAKKAFDFEDKLE